MIVIFMLSSFLFATSLVFLVISIFSSSVKLERPKILLLLGISLVVCMASLIIPTENDNSDNADINIATDTFENTTTEIELFTEEYSSTDNIKPENDIEIHIYDYARLKNVMNGNRTEKIGEYSIIEVPYSEVTDEALEDWYFNYVIKNDYNYYIILYLDTDECKGVYAIPGLVEKDVFFTEDEYGDYSISETSASDESITYIPTENNTLEELSFQ